MPPNKTEQIDVSLSLADDAAMNNLIDMVTRLSQQLNVIDAQINTSPNGIGSGGGGTGTGGGGTGGTAMVPKSGERSSHGSVPTVAPPAGAARSSGASNLTLEERYKERYMEEQHAAALEEGYARFTETIGPEPTRAERFYAATPGPLRPIVQLPGKVMGHLKQGEYDEAFLGAYGAYQIGQGTVQRFAPYLPMQAQRVGQQAGLPGGDSVLGVFQNPLPFGPGQSPAASQYYGDFFDSMTAMFEGGVTREGEWDLNQALLGAGWRGERQEVLENAITQLNKDVGGEGILDPVVTASMVDQATRLSQYPLEDFINTLKTVPTTARAANMGIAEFQQQLDQMGNYLQEKGLTYGAGVQAANRFSGLTNMTPLAGQQLMENQFIQANMMGRYGLLPEQQGLVFGQAQGAFANTALDTIDQMRELYRGTFPRQDIKVAGQNIQLGAKEQIDPLIAEQMGISIEELRDLEKNERRIRIQGNVGTLAEQYNRDVGSLQGMLDRGKITDEQYARQVDNLRKGKGAYAGPDAVSWREVMEQMRRKDSGFRQHIEELDALPPGERAAAVRRIIQRQGRRREDDAATKDRLDLTPAAKKLVRFLEDTNQVATEAERRTANAAQAVANASFSDSVTRRPSVWGPAADAIRQGQIDAGI